MVNLHLLSYGALMTDKMLKIKKIMEKKGKGKELYLSVYSL